MYIRQFAFRTNLRELAFVLSKDEPEYADFCLLKALLKHLSYLSSNALVRKSVIEGAWHLRSKVLHVVEQKLLQMTSESIQQDKFHLFYSLELILHQLKNMYLVFVFDVV